MQNRYEYASSIQRQLLATLVRYPDEAFGIVEPRYISDPFLSPIALVVHDRLAAVKNLKKLRLDETTVWELVRSARKKDENFFERKESYRLAIGQLLSMPLANKEILLNEAKKFAKETRFRIALSKAEEDITNGRFDLVQKRFLDAELPGGAKDEQIQLVSLPLHRFLGDGDMPDEEGDYVVSPIISKGGAVLVYGLPKSLKSWFALALGIDASSGRKALDFFPVSRRTKMLYIQVEDVTSLTRKRIGEVRRGQGFRQPYPWMFKVIGRCPLNLLDPKWFAALRNDIATFRPELVVLDVLRRLFIGDVNNAKDTADFLRRIDTLRDEFGCAVVLVHHSKKGGTDEIESKALGSVNFTGWAETLVYVHRKHLVGTATVCEVEIESKSGIIENTLLLSVDSEAFPMVSLQRREDFELQRIVDLLNEKPGLNQKELAKQSGFPDKKLRSLLKKGLESKLWIEEHGEKKTLRYFPQ